MEIDFSKLYKPTISYYSEDMNEIDEILETEEILYVISKNIIFYRKENNLTQKQLAKKLNVNQTMISKLESGNYNPTFKQIYKITKRLTRNSELYKKILEEIIDNLNKYEKMQYNLSIMCKKNKEGIEKLYSKMENNILVLNIDKKDRRENLNGKYQSEISNVG